jgi:histidinol-phosphate aminotransferase
LKLQIPENLRSIPQYPRIISQQELLRKSSTHPLVSLASNENSWGPSPRVAKALSQALKTMHRYPDHIHFSLAEGISQKVGLSVDEIVLGNGSSEVLDLLMRVFMRSGHEIITSYPSYLMYQKLVRIHDGTNIVVPLKRLSHDLSQILASITQKTQFIILDNPNNPIGTAVNPWELYSFLSEIPESVIVVLDEAYVEFLDQEKQVDIFSLIRNNKNRCGVVSLRTFSLAYGLADIRIGYGIMPSEIAVCLKKFQQPFYISEMIQSAGLAALNDREYLQLTLERTRKGKDFLREEVKKLGCTCYPSQTNFFLIDVKIDATRLYEAMLDRAVIICPMKAYGLPNCIRVTVGTDEENKRFLAVLAECLMELEDE